MALHLYSALTVFVLALSFSLADNAENSINCTDILYLEQPMTELYCNPYNSSMKLKCSLYHFKGLGNFTIKWFKNNITHELNTSQPASNQALLSSELEINGTNLTAGNFWCQPVQSGEESSDYPRSTLFELMPEEVYQDYEACDGLVISQQKVTTLCSRGEPPSPTAPVRVDEISAVASGVVAAVFLVILSVLLCVICCLQRSKYKLKRKADPKPSTNSREGLESLQATCTHAIVSAPEPDDQPISTFVSSTHSQHTDLLDSLGYENASSTSFPVAMETTGSSRPTSSGTSHSYSIMDAMATDMKGEALYHPLDTDTQDADHDYTDRRRPPPVSPKKPVLKPQSLSTKTAALDPSKLAVLVGGLPVTKQLPPIPKKPDIQNKRGIASGTDSSPSGRGQLAPSAEQYHLPSLSN